MTVLPLLTLAAFVAGASRESPEQWLTDGSFEGKLVSVAFVRQRLTVPVGSNSHAIATGSGFIVSRSDTRVLLVTNAHVIPIEHKHVELIGENWYAFGKVVAIDRALDLALVEFTELSRMVGHDATLAELAALELATETPAEGPVAILGFPYGQVNFEASVTVGQITAGASAQSNGMAEINARASPGNSGGPALGGDGRVVGVLTSGIPGTSRSFLIPVEVVRKFLARHSITPQRSSSAQVVVANDERLPRSLASSLVNIRQGSRWVGFAVATGASEGATLLAAHVFGQCRAVDDDHPPCEAEFLSPTGPIRLPLEIESDYAIVRTNLLRPLPVASVHLRAFSPLLRTPWSLPHEAVMRELSPQELKWANEPLHPLAFSTAGLPILGEGGEIQAVARSIEEVRLRPPGSLDVRTAGDCTAELRWSSPMKVPVTVLLHVATNDGPEEETVERLVAADATSVMVPLEGCTAPDFRAIVRAVFSPLNVRQVYQAEIAFSSWGFVAPPGWGHVPVIRADPKDRLPRDRSTDLDWQRVDPRQAIYECQGPDELFVEHRPIQITRPPKHRQADWYIGPDGLVVVNELVSLGPKLLPELHPVSGSGLCVAADGDLVKPLCGYRAARSKDEQLVFYGLRGLMIVRRDGSSRVPLPCRDRCLVVAARGTRKGYQIAWIARPPGSFYTTAAISVSTIERGRITRTRSYSPLAESIPQKCGFGESDELLCELESGMRVFTARGKRPPSLPARRCRMVRRPCVSSDASGQMCQHVRDQL